MSHPSISQGGLVDETARDVCCKEALKVEAVLVLSNIAAIEGVDRHGSLSESQSLHFQWR
jgi:hypothetical protein